MCVCVILTALNLTAVKIIISVSTETSVLT